MASIKIAVPRKHYEDAIFSSLLALVQEEDPTLAVSESAKIMVERLDSDCGFDSSQLSKKMDEFIDLINCGAETAHVFYKNYSDNKQFNIRKKQKKRKHLDQLTRIFRGIANFTNDKVPTNPDLCHVCARVYLELNISKRLVL